MPLLLLDFDGVLLRNHPIYDTISHRCQTFAQRYAPIRNPIKMGQINREMYECYGHTVLGLRALGYKVSLNEFNHHVYNNIDFKSLNDVRYTHKGDIRQVKNMLQRVKHEELYGDNKDNKVTIRLMSNAPDTWCETVLDMMGLDQIEKVQTLCYLKPEQNCYEFVERQYPEERNFILVDDKMINFKGVMQRPTWNKILYTGCDGSEHTHYEMTNISTLNRLENLTDTIAWKKGSASLCKI